MRNCQGSIAPFFIFSLTTVSNTFDSDQDNWFEKNRTYNNVKLFVELSTMDKIINKIAALGVPGLILLVAMAVSGWAGAAAITTALASLGGPFGMLGGVAVLGILALISQGLTEYGFETIFRGVVDKLIKQGMSLEEIQKQVNKYPISKQLKQKIQEYIKEEITRRQQSTKSQSNSSYDYLYSEKGIDYKKLRLFLRNQEWKQADIETASCIRKALDKTEEELISSEQIKNIPCTDLKTIDSLWVKYSNQKWGFSIQEKIYVDCSIEIDGRQPNDDLWNQFSTCVGWRKNGEYQPYTSFILNLETSPRGLLPVFYAMDEQGKRIYRDYYGFLFPALVNRLTKCN